MQTKNILIISITLSIFFFLIFNYYENKKDHYNLICNGVVIVKNSNNLKFNDGLWKFKNEIFIPKENEECTVKKYIGV